MFCGVWSWETSPKSALSVTAGWLVAATSVSPMILYAYSFIPKKLGSEAQGADDRPDPRRGTQQPHDWGPANGATIVRELMQQGYVVVAPEYRGSTGYGPAHAKATDYGGKRTTMSSALANG